MKNKGLLFAAVVLLCSCSVNQEERKAMMLAERVVPKIVSSLSFEQTNDTSDVFELESVGKKIVVRGNNANSMAVGLNHYLKNFCLTTVSWYAKDPVELPDTLPMVTEKIRSEARAKERFFLNYCTYGYTMPYWGWKEWERMIDWMALNGVTMPLNITGQEATMMKVWERFGVAPERIRESFTGPVFLPWNRLMDIDGWMGPLPQKWIDSQEILQKRILERERELGMKPVLPAFNGHVPAGFAELHPEANVKEVTMWDGFEPEYGCWFLDPEDTLFGKIQKVFLEEQERLYGTSHIYGLDIFNEVHFFDEVDGDEWDPEILAKIAGHVYGTLAEADPEAVWLQVGWPLYHDKEHWPPRNVEAYLKAVPQGRVAMLDYFCDEAEIYSMNENFYGQPYFFCFLGNFGGNTNLSGDFHDLSEKIERVFATGGDNLLGLGGTPEGLGVSQFMYEFLFDKAWTGTVSDSAWVANLADRRFGSENQHCRDAWRLLTDEIYAGGATYSGICPVPCLHPCFEGHWRWTTLADVPYSYSQIASVWKELLASPSERDTYKFDIVNVGSEVLKLAFVPEREAYTKACKAGDVEGMKERIVRMRKLYSDWDALLACHSTFSLKDWLDQARGLGDTDAEKDYYEKCARLIITSWGGTGQLTDYANRQWSGMVSSYYQGRWEMFWKETLENVETRSLFDSLAFDSKIREYELSWGEPSFKLDHPKKGDAYATSCRIAHELDIL